MASKGLKGSGSISTDYEIKKGFKKFNLWVDPQHTANDIGVTTAGAKAKWGTRHLTTYKKKCLQSSQLYEKQNSGETTEVENWLNLPFNSRENCAKRWRIYSAHKNADLTNRQRKKRGISSVNLKEARHFLLRCLIPLRQRDTTARSKRDKLSLT